MPPITTTLKTLVKPQETLGAFIVYLTARFPYLEESEWLSHIESGRVLLNQERVEPHHLVQVDDVISYEIIDHDEGEFPTDIPIIWQNEHFLVASKPADLPIHRSGRIFWHTMVNLLRIELDSSELYPLHRLDRETSGLVLFAKNPNLRRQLKFNLERVLVAKTYLAWVWGSYSGPEHIENYLAERSDSLIKIQMHAFEESQVAPRLEELEVLLEQGDISQAQYKKFKPRKAHTQINCLYSGLLKLPQGNSQAEVSLVEVKLFTGRKHQIRAHLAHLGYPIIGDKMYSQEGKFYLKQCQHEALTSQDWEQLGARTQLLHAHKLMTDIPQLKTQSSLSKPSLSKPSLSKLGKAKRQSPESIQSLEHTSSDWSEDFAALMRQLP